MSQFGFSRPYRPAPVGGPFKVYTVGDSITHGASFVSTGVYNHFGGWRSPLYQGMTVAGANPNFVGGLLNSAETPPVTDAGSAHSGYDGASGSLWYSSAWDNQYPGLFPTRADAPHLILLSVGSNDGDSVPAAQDFCRLMDKAAAAAPQAVIFMATAPITGISGQYDTQATQVIAEVAARKALGMNVVLVDQHFRSGLIASDLSDGLHPKASGYAKMGELWKLAVLPRVT